MLLQILRYLPLLLLKFQGPYFKFFLLVGSVSRCNAGAAQLHEAFGDTSLAWAYRGFIPHHSSTPASVDLDLWSSARHTHLAELE